MNKKDIINQYAKESKINRESTDNKIAQIIIKKATQYNVPLFQNDTLVSRLLDSNNVQELPKNSAAKMAKIFDVLIKVEESAQLSK
jgi:type III secretion system FlhB-like substrate exporter